MSKYNDGLHDGTGVDYGTLDNFKREAGCAAATTGNQLTERFGFQELPWTRGESIFCFKITDGHIIGHVHEGLGTKAMVADAVLQRTGKNLYHHIAQCTLATAFNDASTLGMHPMSASMYLALGHADWFKDKRKSNGLIAGWKAACEKAGCTWGPGETPELKGIVDPHQVELNCSVVAHAPNEAAMMNPANIRNGDVIVFLASSGIHANGLTKAREVGSRLPDGFGTKLKNGETYGEALLRPTVIYAPLIRKLSEQAMMPAYGVNISGHGLCKLMRPTQPFRYVVERLATVTGEFELIQQVANLTDRQMYSAFNMKMGFALYVHPSRVEAVIKEAARCRIRAWKGGYIEDAAESEVILTQKNIRYTAEDLQIR